MKRRYAWDDRAPSFRQVGDVAASVAEHHAGVQLDEVTRERWRELMALLREVDTHVDGGEVSHARVMAELRDFGGLRDYYPALAPEVMTTQQNEAVLARTETILALGRVATTTADVDEFMTARINEADETAGLLDDVASSDVVAQPQYENFQVAIRSMSRVACLLDTWLDASADRAAGTFFLPQNSGYRGRLLREAWHESPPAMRAVLHAHVLGGFAVMSVNRLQNRIRHGVSADSSLRILWSNISHK